MAKREPPVGMEMGKNGKLEYTDKPDAVTNVRASAAQMAKRRVNAAKTRRPASGTPGHNAASNNQAPWQPDTGGMGNGTQNQFGGTSQAGHNAASNNQAPWQPDTGGMGNGTQNRFGSTSQAGPGFAQSSTQSAPFHAFGNSMNASTQSAPSPAFGNSMNASTQSVSYPHFGNGTNTPTQSNQFPAFGANTNTNEFNFSHNPNISNPFTTAANGSVGMSQPFGSAPSPGFQGSIFNIPPQSATPAVNPNNTIYNFGQSNTQPQQPQQYQTAHTSNNGSNSLFQPQQPQQHHTANTSNNGSNSLFRPQQPQQPQQHYAAQTSNNGSNSLFQPQQPQQPQQNHTANTSNNGSTGLFGQSGASGNQAGANPQQATSNLFGSLTSQQALPTNNFFGPGAGSTTQAQLPESAKAIDDRMSTTPDTSPQTAKEQTSNHLSTNHLPPSPSPQGSTAGQPSSNGFFSTVNEKSENSAPAKEGGSLFDRITQPPKASDQPSTNDASSHATQETPKRIFASMKNTSSVKASAHNAEAPKSIFANLAPAKPSAFTGGFTSPAKPIEDAAASTASETPKNIFAGFAPTASSASASSGGISSPAKPNADNAKPLLSWAPPSDKPNSQASGNGLTGLNASSSQSSLPAASISPAPFQAPPDQTSPSTSTLPTATTALAPQQSTAVDNSTAAVSRRMSITSSAQSAHEELTSSFESSFGKVPHCSSATTPEEQRTICTLWRLKGLHTGALKLANMGNANFDTIEAYYVNRKLAIIHAAGLSLEQVAGSKRKSSIEEHESSSPKKARSTASTTPSVSSTTLNNDHLVNGLGSLQKAWAEGSLARLSSPKKRKADEEPEEDSARYRMKARKAETRKRIMGSGMIAGDREAQAAGDVSYPSLSSFNASETSNIFKSIVNNEDRQPTGRSTKPTDGTSSSGPTKQGSKVTSGPSKVMSTSNGDTRQSQDATPAPQVSNGDLFANAGSFTSSSLFSKPNATSATPVFPNNTASSAFGEPNAATTTPFSSSIAPSPKSSGTNGIASPSKVNVEEPTFEPPKFDTAAPANFMSQFAKASEASEKKDREKRKAEEFDSDEDNDADWDRKYDEEQRAKKQKIDDSIKGKSAKYVVGKGFIFTDDEESNNTNRDLGSDTASSNQSSRAPSVSVFDQPFKPAGNGLNMFSQLSDADSGAEGSKVGDADDEITNSEDVEDEDAGSEDEEDPERAASDVSGNEEDTENHDNALEQDSSIEAPIPSNPSKVSTSSKPEANTSASGLSLFDRISKDENGQVIRELPPVEEKKSSSLFDPSASQKGSGGMFGNSASILSSTKDIGKPFTGFDFSSTIPNTKANDFGQSSTPQAETKAIDADASSVDQTWKADSPIKFSATGAAPSVKVTSPTPSKHSFGGLFGSSAKSGATETPSKPASSILGTTSTQSPSVGFGFSLGGPTKPDASSLLTPSDAPANDSSRATSPGASSVAESADGSTADVGPEETQGESEQANFSSKGPGEGDEDSLFDVRCKALLYDETDKKWVNKGVGRLRILMHPQTGKTRILMRQDPSGRVMINAAVHGSMEYDLVAPKSVKLPIVTEDGKLAMFMVRVGKEEDAKRLAAVLEDSKKTS